MNLACRHSFFPALADVAWGIFATVWKTKVAAEESGGFVRGNCAVYGGYAGFFVGGGFALAEAGNRYRSF